MHYRGLLTCVFLSLPHARTSGSVCDRVEASHGWGIVLSFGVPVLNFQLPLWGGGEEVEFEISWPSARIGPNQT